ncbi:MAG: hypothetical protein FJY35_09260 [Betaproteobacteria bacterium]|nr:hypothetical protein [Betaproteobacteria bacterium]
MRIAVSPVKTLGIFITVIFSLAVAPHARAQSQWTRFATGLPGGTLAGWYYDKELVRDTGTRKVLWVLKDLNKLDENERHSYRFLVQMDCKENKFRFIQVAGFKEPMAAGEPVGVDSSLGRWVSMAPDTLFAHVNGLICGLKPAGASS